MMRIFLMCATQQNLIKSYIEPPDLMNLLLYLTAMSNNTSFTFLKEQNVSHFLEGRQKKFHTL